jgi:hypothetical protein
MIRRYFELVAIRIEHKHLEVTVQYAGLCHTITELLCLCVDAPDILLSGHMHTHMVEPGELRAFRKAFRQDDAE